MHRTYARVTSLSCRCSADGPVPRMGPREPLPGAIAAAADLQRQRQRRKGGLHPSGSA